MEQRFLRLYIGIFRKQLYISVTNATGELVRKLDEEYITTKRGNHGHGLKRINNTVEKYGGFINRKNEPGVFATEIMRRCKEKWRWDDNSCTENDRSCTNCFFVPDLCYDTGKGRNEE